MSVKALFGANKGTFQTAQQIAPHESPRTTKFYDKTQNQLTPG
jgi:hypothetical protein